MSGERAFLKAVAAAGGLASGGPVPDTFERGWATHPFRGTKAHYWEKAGVKERQDGQVATELVSKCRLKAWMTPAYRLLEPGNFDYCQRCEARLLKKRGL